MAMASRLSVTGVHGGGHQGNVQIDFARKPGGAIVTAVGMTSDGPGSSKTSSKVSPSRISMETPRFAGGVFDRFDRQQVDPDQPHRPAMHRHLQPSAGRTAQVDDARAALDQFEAIVDLGQLVGGARTHALGLGALDIGVRQLPLQPALAGGRALVGGLQTDLDVTACRGAPAGGPDHPALFFVAHALSYPATAPRARLM
jgi:hypothetical protein